MYTSAFIKMHRPNTFVNSHVETYFKSAVQMVFNVQKIVYRCQYVK